MKRKKGDGEGRYEGPSHLPDNLERICQGLNEPRVEIDVGCGRF